MKLKSIVTYQAVNWNKNNTHFISNAIKGHEGVEITLQKEGYVTVQKNNEMIIVFPTNISYAVPLQSQDTSQESKVEKKSK